MQWTWSVHSFSHFPSFKSLKAFTRLYYIHNNLPPISSASRLCKDQETQSAKHVSQQERVGFSRFILHMYIVDERIHIGCILLDMIYACMYTLYTPLDKTSTIHSGLGKGMLQTWNMAVDASKPLLGPKCLALRRVQYRRLRYCWWTIHLAIQTLDMVNTHHLQCFTHVHQPNQLDSIATTIKANHQNEAMI